MGHYKPYKLTTTTKDNVIAVYILLGGLYICRSEIRCFFREVLHYGSE
jgi:hypothetical protein